MKIGRNSVVTLSYTLYDAQGEVIEESKEPITYLHGGFSGIFERVEQALQDKGVGQGVRVKLEPEDAFGDYNDQLLRVEERSRFPETLEVGMMFEGMPGEELRTDDDEPTLFTVTDIADGKVVLDGNHPLAGMGLVFDCKILKIRAASPEEVAHGHVHGAGGHHH